MKFLFNPKKCLSLFYYVDFFKQNILLKMKGKSLVSLFYGKILSIALISFLIFHVLNSDMLNKSNPIVLQQFIKTKSRPQIDLNENNFFFAFYLCDDVYSYPYDPTLFTITLNHISYSNGEAFSKVLEFEECTDNNFKNFPGITMPTYQNLSCIKNLNASLKGYWDEDETNYFSITVNRCINTTENSICKSENEIQDFFKIRYFEFYVLERSFDLNNFENPISTNIKCIFTGLEFGRRKEVSNFIKQTKILSDNQAFFSQYEELETFAVESGFGFPDYQQSEETLLSYNFYSSDYVQMFHRRYQKLFDLLATLGGIINPLIIFGTAIVKIIHGWEINEMIIRKIYDSELGEAKTMKSKKSCKNHLKFSIWERIKYIFKRRKNFNHKEETYYTYLKKAAKKIDLFSILKKLEEIEKLKLLILNKRQLNIFNSFNKNMLIINDTFHSPIAHGHYILGSNVSNDRKQTLMIDLENIKSDRNPSKIDRNLLKLIGPNYLKKKIML